jgi:hypothetical protein
VVQLGVEQFGFQVGEAFVEEAIVGAGGLQLLLQAAVVVGELAYALLECGVLFGQTLGGAFGVLGLQITKLSEEDADPLALAVDLGEDGLECVFGVECALVPGRLNLRVVRYLCSAPLVAVGGDPGGWHPVQRTFRDGHTETWWATDAQLGWWGPDGHTRLVIATTDPQTLPEKATWYLATNLTRPGGPHDTPGSVHEPADLTEVVRLYGIRHSRSVGTPGSPHHPQTTASPPHLRNRQTTTPERGARQPARRLNRPAGPKRCAPSAPGSPHGYCFNAGGRPGPTHHHPPNSSNSCTLSKALLCRLIG